MSEQLRHKMKDLEVVPPPAAWEAIAERLYADKQYATVSFKMNNFEVTPPAGWEAIADRLHDDKQYATVSFKMNNFEASSPARAWDNILVSLEETKNEKTPVINIRRIIYRVAAAAVIVGFSIGGWVMLNKNSTPQTDVAATTSTIPVTPPVQPATTDNTKKVTTDDSTTADQKQDNGNMPIQNNEAARHNERSNHSLPVADNYKDNTLKYARVNSLPAYSKIPAAVTAPPLLDNDGKPIMDMDVLTTSSNYLVVTGPNGQLTRISSKFASVIRYLNNNDLADTEEYLDKVIKESGTWKKRFQEWRNKISQSSYIPSSVNFLDIVEFKDLIQEKQ